ncbi:hypothetical protein J7E97_10855 [Streptomyces sp. ISL-66]|uniref:hypothetical protein n=1 Tax=Streptomyces sp. ISL-66 TaxID=2819186 RepID=UPI001BE59516|nr:hypothetical protein [Streptomyces sp. ISL-66]MBT2468364.1 hypothetical protein [Streptomyces sp. ISL-66]
MGTGRGDGHHRGTPEERSHYQKRKAAERDKKLQEAEEERREQTTAPEVVEYLRGLTPWAEVVGQGPPKGSRTARRTRMTWVSTGT